MAQVGTLLARLCVGLTLDPAEPAKDPRNAQIGGAFLAVTRLMGQCEVVLFVLPLISKRDNVVDLQFITLQREIDRFLADETDFVLPLVQAVLKLMTPARFELQLSA